MWTTSASCSPPWQATHPKGSPFCRRLAMTVSCLPPLSHRSACAPPRWSSSHTTGMLLRCVHMHAVFPTITTNLTHILTLNNAVANQKDLKMNLEATGTRRWRKDIVLKIEKCWYSGHSCGLSAPSWFLSVSHIELRGWKFYRGTPAERGTFIALRRLEMRGYRA